MGASDDGIVRKCRVASTRRLRDEFGLRAGEREGVMAGCSPVFVATRSAEEKDRKRRAHHVAVGPCLLGDVTRYILSSPVLAGCTVVYGPPEAMDMSGRLAEVAEDIEGMGMVRLEEIEVARSLSSSEGSVIVDEPLGGERMPSWFAEVLGGVDGAGMIQLEEGEVVKSLSSSEGSSFRESQKAELSVPIKARRSATSCDSSRCLRLAWRRSKSASCRRSSASRARNAASREQNSAWRRSSLLARLHTP